MFAFDPTRGPQGTGSPLPQHPQGRAPAAAPIPVANETLRQLDLERRQRTFTASPSAPPAPPSNPGSRIATSHDLPPAPPSNPGSRVGTYDRPPAPPSNPGSRVGTRGDLPSDIQHLLLPPAAIEPPPASSSVPDPWNRRPAPYSLPNPSISAPARRPVSSPLVLHTNTPPSSNRGSRVATPYDRLSDIRHLLVPPPAVAPPPEFSRLPVPTQYIPPHPSTYTPARLPVFTPVVFSTNLPPPPPPPAPITVVSPPPLKNKEWTQVDAGAIILGIGAVIAVAGLVIALMKYRGVITQEITVHGHSYNLGSVVGGIVGVTGIVTAISGIILMASAKKKSQAEILEEIRDEQFRTRGVNLQYPPGYVGQ